jgi:hypothetical protein
MGKSKYLINLSRTQKADSATCFYKVDPDVAMQKIGELLAPNNLDEDEQCPMESEPIIQTTQQQYTVIYEGGVGGYPPVRLEDLEKIGILGHGASGFVEKCVHLPSNTFVAVKVKS